MLTHWRIERLVPEVTSGVTPNVGGALHLSLAK